HLPAAGVGVGVGRVSARSRRHRRPLAPPLRRARRDSLAAESDAPPASARPQVQRYLIMSAAAVDSAAVAVRNTCGCKNTGCKTRKCACFRDGLPCIRGRCKCEGCANNSRGLGYRCVADEVQLQKHQMQNQGCVHVSGRIRVALVYASVSAVRTIRVGWSMRQIAGRRSANAKEPNAKPTCAHVSVRIRIALVYASVRAAKTLRRGWSMREIAGRRSANAKEPNAKPTCAHVSVRIRVALGYASVRAARTLRRAWPMRVIRGAPAS
uniref:Tesmin/TSO1-like CXC domain-containing protein n=1 Tax=Aegilops tauschii subsp. strangulata TaxID=200361 RepID=A0A453A2F0_AEGTS